VRIPIRFRLFLRRKIFLAAEKGGVVEDYKIMTPFADALIIGAGVAGLTAAADLSTAGLRVTLLEARDRTDGRILTDHTNPYPVELGAEFVHGRPEEIFEVVRQDNIPVKELQWNVLRREGKRWYDAAEVMSGMDELFKKMSADGPDQSFQQFLDSVQDDPAVKEQAANFVEGFHAADPRRVSVHALIASTKAEKEIDDDHQFRLPGGYDLLVKSIFRRVDWKLCELRLNTQVKEIRWRPDEVLVKSSSGEEFRAPRVIVSVPLGVLKAGSIRFAPELREKQKALDCLEMGPVVRASLCFHDKFWEAMPRFKDVSFLFTDDPRFPTWWTSNPLPFPIVTGWAAGHYARALAHLTRDQVINRALESLADIFEMEIIRLRGQLQAGFTHDWAGDPFSCGAYSYTLVGGAWAARDLAVPVSQTLFFAGEATNFDGHNGTVHGAIASGKRVAKEVLAAD
jgi:monoamine oxidase